MKNKIKAKIDTLKECINECDYYINEQFEQIHGYKLLKDKNALAWQKYNKIENDLKKIDDMNEQKNKYQFAIMVLNEILENK